MILDRAKKIFNLLEGLQTRNVMQFATKCHASLNFIILDCIFHNSKYEENKS